MLNLVLNTEAAYPRDLVSFALRRGGGAPWAETGGPAMILPRLGQEYDDERETRTRRACEAQAHRRGHGRGGTTRRG